MIKTAMIVPGFMRNSLQQARNLIGCAEMLKSSLPNTEGSATELWIIKPDLPEPYNRLPVDQLVLLSGGKDTLPAAEKYVDAVKSLLEEREISIAVFCGNKFGDELAQRVAERKKAGFVSKITQIKASCDTLYVKRPAYASNLIAEFSVDIHNAVISAADGAFEAEEKEGRPEVTEISITEAERDWCISEKFCKEAAEKFGLEKAEFVLIGGRGMQNASNFNKLAGLAAQIGAKVGCSRPPMLDAWASHAQLVGASGKSIRPRLCITFGVSGAGPFLAGIEKSETIIAVNTDPDALIFKYCDYAILGDCVKAVDELSEIVGREMKNGKNIQQ